MLEKEFKYFVSHHDEIFRDHPNKFVVISGEAVVSAAESFDEALSQAMAQGLEPGTFLIQECTEGDDAYTQTFHTRVVFS
ncbi:hypothetical protein [Sodaliphilus sp.]|uniref:hypothetical protein n=1 Tax=Sodaliphilus sp. TaxID=2815818 RepID=UPI0038901F75